jgi:hypothetical protein
MTSVQVFGIKEALKELSALDPNLRKQINRDAKTIAKPATDGIKNAYPNKYLSGMSKPWVQRSRQLFPYDAALARKGVQLKIATGKKNVSVIGIEQKDPAAAIIDMAGKKGGTSTQGARFIASLDGNVWRTLACYVARVRKERQRRRAQHVNGGRACHGSH